MKTYKICLIPKYAIIPALIYILLIPSYFISKIVTANMVHHSVSIELDDAIPMVPVFIWIYVLAYLQWFIGYVSMAYSDERICKKYMGGELIAKLCCLLIFIIIPTSLVRPEISGSGITADAMRWMYSIDTADTLFPSLHCLESWIVARGLSETRAPKPIKILMWVFSILVFLSVVFVKQHLVLDIPAAIIVAELGIFVGEKIKIHRFYDFIEEKLNLRKKAT